MGSGAGEAGEAAPLRLILIGGQVYGSGQVNYSVQIDGGELFEGFSPRGEHSAFLAGTPAVSRLVEQFKRGNKVLFGAVDSRKNVSVFELSLAGFTKTFNQTFPSRCLK